MALLIAGPALTAVAQTGSHGPEVQSFLELMHHEEDELEYQIKHDEISRQEYLRSKNRIAIHRQTVLNIVSQRRQDSVPEIHVVVAEEIEQLIEGGLDAVKGLKRGDSIGEKWRYLGTALRSETFYIFERLKVK